MTEMSKLRRAIDLCNQGCKLQTESHKLFDEGERLWDEALIETFGHIPNCLRDIGVFIHEDL